MNTIARRFASQLSALVATLAVATTLPVSIQVAVGQPHSHAIYSLGNDSDHSHESEHVEAFTFDDSDRWSSTATDGFIFSPRQGKPTTLTWSFVRDGGAIGTAGNIPSESTAPSSLIAQLDSNFGVVGGGSDLTTRPWFAVFQTAFNRFSQLSGLSYVYEPNDSGSFTGTSGVLGVRGDVRIGGHSIDGNSGSNILAYNYFPNFGDMVLDTDNTSFYSSNTTGFRNILMHEHGHGLGIGHVEPTNQTKLMEPFISTAFEGPQIDDILAIHRGYGDFYEKSNGGAGNEVFSNATPLGTVAVNSTVSIGTDAADPGLSAEVFPGESDFISIDDNSDTDYLSFTLLTSAKVSLNLMPAGPTYNVGPDDGIGGNEPSFNASAQNNLAITLFDTTGVGAIATANGAGLGAAEVITDQVLTAGTYYARITGSLNTTQLYQLDVSAALVPEPNSVALLLSAAAIALGFRRRQKC